MKKGQHNNWRMTASFCALIFFCGIISQELWQALLMSACAGYSCHIATQEKPSKRQIVLAAIFIFFSLYLGETTQEHKWWPKGHHLCCFT